MDHTPKRIGALVLRLMEGLALLGCPRAGSAQGSWSVISLPQKPGDLYAFGDVAVDTAGNLYVVDYAGNDQYRIEKRDAQGNWSVIAYDAALGPVSAAALAVDGYDSLYVADTGNNQVLKYTPHP